MARLRVGVAGCGAVGQIMHLPHLRELDDLYELVAIADADAETLELVGDHYRVAVRHASFAELLRAPIDAVLILTPGSHGQQCLAAASAGKHVFVEKPLCYTLRECDQVAEAVERAGITLQVGYMKRYDPAYRRALELLRGSRTCATGRSRPSIRRATSSSPIIRYADAGASRRHTPTGRRRTPCRRTTRCGSTAMRANSCARRSGARRHSTSWSPSR
ncbi:MAG TPA: Gfo/Idh/MocA family oxidoreductase [Chloroflexota bacterium]